MPRNVHGQQAGEHKVNDPGVENDVELPSPKKKRRRFFLSCTFVVLLVAPAFFLHRPKMPWHHLAQVVRIEADGTDEYSAQTLAESLTILGRDHEVRSLDMHPQYEFPESTIAPTVQLDFVPWKPGIEEIAAKYQIVMLSENHTASKHREMTRATLPIFRDAGFTHLAVEAIGESKATLARRGYPSSRTGVYTADPQFGNLIRRALQLDFLVTGYDFRPFSHDVREESAASRLAELIQEDNARLLVHAGPGHVVKQNPQTPWLAQILWEKTGIEPFTIWQWSEDYDARDYRAILPQLTKQLEDFKEPALLFPPADRNGGWQHIPAIDAILVHPPDKSTAPAHRTPLFADNLQSITGTWQSDRWPVVIAACKTGEPITAIPLDQVMLRPGEKEFVLWIPANTKYALRVFDAKGVVSTLTKENAASVSVSETP